MDGQRQLRDQSRLIRDAEKVRWLLAAKGRSLYFYGLPPLVITAYRTGVVGTAHGPALRTARKAG